MNRTAEFVTRNLHMAPGTLLRKFVHLIRDEGPLAAVGEGTGYLQRHLDDALEGTPGYYDLRLRLLLRKYARETLTPVWVSPTDITSLTGPYEARSSGHLDYHPQFKPREADWDDVEYVRELPYGSIVGGDWDTQREPFSKLLMYRGIRQRYVDGLPWEETVYYERLVERFVPRWEQDEAKRLAIQRCERISALHETIASEGYHSQQALDGHPLHEVTVTVARNGELLYNCEGRHRLSLAKVLDVEAIPVLVLARHEAFDGDIRIRNEQGEDG